jgi:hypothetical protein
MFSLRNQHDFYNPNLTITNYFEAVVNELDIKAETILAELSSSAAVAEPDTHSKKENVNRVRDSFIAELRTIETENLDRLRAERLANPEKKITHNVKAEHLFKKFSFLIDKSCFPLDTGNSSFLKDKKFDLGLLVLTNEFIEPDEINDLKKLLNLSLENKSLLNYFFEINSELKNVIYSMK